MYAHVALFLRYALMIAAGFMVNRGVISGEMTELVVAGGLAGFTMVWKIVEMMYEKRKV